jgi:hypothetical protein
MAVKFSGFKRMFWGLQGAQAALVRMPALKWCEMLLLLSVLGLHPMAMAGCRKRLPWTHHHFQVGILMMAANGSADHNGNGDCCAELHCQRISEAIRAKWPATGCSLPAESHVRLRKLSIQRDNFPRTKRIGWNWKRL